MNISPNAHSVFDYFQNLNLLVLLEDLRHGQTARGSWITGSLLCPIAHGLGDAEIVADMRYLQEAAPLPRSCDYAARRLGADPESVYRFVIDWDRGRIAPERLREQLEAIWRERVEDAAAVQEVLEGGTAKKAGGIDASKPCVHDHLSGRPH